MRPVLRSWTKTSNEQQSLSPATRLRASELNATMRPSAEIAGSSLKPLPCPPVDDTLTRSVVPVFRSRTKMSSAPFVSPATRLLAYETKAT